MVGCELLRAQKYDVRRQCDNIDIWTVPYDGSSNIILSTIEKRGGLADYGLWERVYLESDCIREKDSPMSKISKREFGMGPFA